MQKYHDEPKQYKGYLKSALVLGTGGGPDAGAHQDRRHADDPCSSSPRPHPWPACRRPPAGARPIVCSVTRPGPVKVLKNNPSPPKSARFTVPAHAAL